MGGILGWTPQDTAAATLPEILLAVRGWQRSMGVDPDRPQPASHTPMTRARYEDLKREYCT